MEQKPNEDEFRWVWSAGALPGRAPTESELVTAFDQLVKDGLIQYDSLFLTETQNINGIRVSYLLSMIPCLKTNSRTKVRIPHL